MTRCVYGLVCEFGVVSLWEMHKVRREIAAAREEASSARAEIAAVSSTQKEIGTGIVTAEDVTAIRNELEQLQLAVTQRPEQVKPKS